MSLRETPTLEFERLAKSLNFALGDVIEDKQTFFVGFEDFLYPNSKAINNPKLRAKTFDAYKDLYGISGVNTNTRVEAIHKIGRGKRFNQDRQRTAKKVYVDTKEGRHQYIKTGASKSDIEGVDTKTKKVARHKFGYVGKTGDKVVNARKTKVKIKGKESSKFRDSSGKFVNVKKNAKK